MRLIHCSVENFASYQYLEFNYEDLGLSLVYGATGSGKSTLQDFACWCLFGETPKGGAVDDIRSWNSEEETIGILKLSAKGSILTITRIRGSASKNDLYWREDGSEEQRRGKDLVDTQKLLNERVGMNFDLYCTAAYFNEFSPTSNFFLARSKERRATMERVASLEFPKMLADVATTEKRAAKTKYNTVKAELDRNEGRLAQLFQTLEEISEREDNWQRDQELVLKGLRVQAEQFETNKNNKIAAIGVRLESLRPVPPQRFEEQLRDLRERTRCEACGAQKRNVQIQIEGLLASKAQNDSVIASVDRLQLDLKTAKEGQNVYQKLLAQEEGKTNPFVEQVRKLTDDAQKLDVVQAARYEEVEALEKRVGALEQLYDLSFTLRGRLLRSAVKSIETGTNNYLERFFESELRVAFELKGSDELDVSITKNGHSCSFRQLSKGQRSLLRLCFVSAIMKAAANQAGIHFNQLFFDEALDGLDSDLKVKSYRLFEELSKDHESILVIDHSSDLQNLFSRRFFVKLVDDVSTIEEEV